MCCANTVDAPILPASAPAVASARPSIAIIGLGNPILGDDGVGWRVAEQVAALLPPCDGHADRVEVICCALGGLSLMERLIGFEHAIIIDAVQTAGSQPGRLHDLTLRDLPEHTAGHLTAAHDTSLTTALRLGRQMGATLPDTIIIVGIEATRVYDFSEELSPEVAEAVPHAADLVLRTLAGLPRAPTP